MAKSDIEIAREATLKPITEIAQKLNDSDFGSLEERSELFAQALPLALEDSARIWLLDRLQR